MKKWTALALVAVMGFMLFGMESCGIIDTSAPRNVDYEPLADGIGIKVTWDAPSGEDTPDEYVVIVDGERQVAVTVTEEEINVPAEIIQVVAVYGNEESNPDDAELDFGIVETDNIEVWSINDPSADHPSGFGFNVASGSAAAYSVAQEWDQIHFYVSMGYEGQNEPTLTSPGDKPDEESDWINTSYKASVTYDALEELSASGAWSTQTELEGNAAYGLWISESMTYTEDDYFGKLHVTSLTNPSGDVYNANIKVGFQLNKGVRWTK